MHVCVWLWGPLLQRAGYAICPGAHFCSGQAIYTTKRDMGCECFSRFGVCIGTQLGCNKKNSMCLHVFLPHTLESTCTLTILLFVQGFRRGHVSKVTCDICSSKVSGDAMSTFTLTIVFVRSRFQAMPCPHVCKQGHALHVFVQGHMLHFFDQSASDRS